MHDIWFGRKVLPVDCRGMDGPFLNGKKVAFEAESNTEGRLRTTMVRFLASKVDGGRCCGRFESFSDEKGYGFLSSSMLPGEEMRWTGYGSGSPKVLIGQEVTFKLKTMSDGTFGAQGVNRHEHRWLWSCSGVVKRIEKEHTKGECGARAVPKQEDACDRHLEEQLRSSRGHRECNV